MIRRGLGRGLDALIESTEGAMASDPSPARADIDGGGVSSVELDRIVPSPLQPRRHFDSGRLQELAQAIRSQGVIEPLVVRPAPPADGAAAARYELVAGERRWRAARLAGLERRAGSGARTRRPCGARDVAGRKPAARGFESRRRGARFRAARAQLRDEPRPGRRAYRQKPPVREQRDPAARPAAGGARNARAR